LSFATPIKRVGRFSLANYREQEDMTNVPLYAIGPCLKQ
jgi:hypothetical protein